MKFLVSICFLIITILILVSCKTQKDEVKNIPQVYATRTDTAVVIDGILDDNIWDLTKPLQLKENYTTSLVSDSSKQTFVRVCYDSLNLYISFECKDQDIWGTYSERDQHLWKEEAVEVFIDVNEIENDYFEIEVSPKNILFDSYIVDPQNIDIFATSKLNLPGIYTAVSVRGTLNQRKDKDSTWTAEILIPFSDLLENYDPQILPNLTWKINFYRINRDYGNSPENYAWSPTKGRFHKPSLFGILNFSNK
jgi:hypothetical protein